MKSTLSFPSRLALGVVLGVVAASALPQLRADTLVVADANSAVIRRYDATTGAYLGVFASGGGLTTPAGLAFGRDGNLYVGNADLPGTVLRYNGRTGAFMDVFVTISGYYLYGMAIGPDGNVYAGLDNGAIERFDGTTGASMGVFIPAHAVYGGMGFHNGSLFVTYLGTSGHPYGELYQYNGTTGAFIANVYSTFSGNGPRDPRSGPDGNLYVPDWQTYHVVKFNGTTLTYVGNIINDATHYWPMSLAFGTDGNTLLVLEDNGLASSINRYNLATGAFINQLVAPGSGGLGRASGLVLVPSPPRLVVAEAHQEALSEVMTLTWTNNGSWCVLESAAAVTGPWGQETTTWSTNANWISTQVTSANSAHFYRLKSNW